MNSSEMQDALRKFVAAERAELDASRQYHATVPHEQKTAERYAEHMRPFWDASQKAHDEYRRLGGRLGA